MVVRNLMFFFTFRDSQLSYTGSDSEFFSEASRKTLTRIRIRNCNIEAVLRSFLTAKLLKLLFYSPKTLPDSEIIQRPFK